MSNDLSRHWNDVYAADPTTKKWHQDVPTVSLTMMAAAGIGNAASVVDVGGGASRFVDHLVDLGFHDLTVFDISEVGMTHAQTRLAESAAEVNWVVGDITQHRFGRTFDLWHDRAVFHFLSKSADREDYRRCLSESVAIGGHAIIATFSPEAPEYCSGLPVTRYDAETLAVAAGEYFQLTEATRERHRTPAGELQSFTWVLLERVSGPAGGEGS